MEPYNDSSTYRTHTRAHLAPSNPISEAAVVNYGYSKGDQVNVRAEPTVSSRVVFRLDKGDLVRVVRKSKNKDYVSGYEPDFWYEVEQKGTYGWVFGQLIGRNDFESTELQNLKKDFQYVNAASVNVRSEPDVRKGRIKFQLHKNQAIEIIAKTRLKYEVGSYGPDFWYYIRSGNKTGWIFGGLIKK